MITTNPHAVHYEARLLENPEDPVNSAWESIYGYGDDTPYTSYSECNKDAVTVINDGICISQYCCDKPEDTLKRLVIAKVTVEYLKP